MLQPNQVANLVGKRPGAAPAPVKQDVPGVDVPFISVETDDIMAARDTGLTAGHFGEDTPLCYVIRTENAPAARRGARPTTKTIVDLYTAQNEWGYDEMVEGDGDNAVTTIVTYEQDGSYIKTGYDEFAALMAAQTAEPEPQQVAAPESQAVQTADVNAPDDYNLYSEAGDIIGTTNPNEIDDHKYGFPQEQFVGRLNSTDYDATRLYFEQHIAQLSDGQGGTLAGEPFALVKTGKGRNVRIICYLHTKNMNVSGNTGTVEWEEGQEPAAPAPKAASTGKVTEVPQVSSAQQVQEYAAPVSEISDQSENVYASADHGSAQADLASAIHHLKQVAASYGLTVEVTIK